MTSLIRYETARAALADALRVDEVMGVRDFAERMKLYGRQARDKSIVADAMALQLRAERKLGVLIISAKETGQLGAGRPKSNVLDQPDPDRATDDAQNSTAPVPFSRTTLSDIGIDKKLSAKAQAWARLGDPEFEAHLAGMRERLESSGAIVVNPMKDLSTAQKKTRRSEREAELGKKQQALPEAKFGVIYADPEWRFEPRSRETGMDRAPENHYPTSELADIKGRDVGSLAAKDCVLFLWATAPMLPQALEVMAAWGFAYKTHFVWSKQRVGTGYWNRSRHEILLLGTIGSPPAPAMGAQWESVIEDDVREHSEKPAIFYELIEEYFPTLPKIELNARVAREGWARWGLEAPAAEAPENSPETATTQRAHVIPQREDIGDDVQATAQNAGVTAGETAAGEATHPASPAFKFTPTDDAMLRAAYALPIERFDLNILAVTIGCSKAQARKRASHLGLGSRERQRSAASAFATALNARGEL